ncbi:unnamed protein product [Polarella glacialis]|nr:unnamed protein product [Polarella glacialis]
MRWRGFLQDAVGCGAVLRACSSARQWQMCIVLLLEMRSARLVPDVQAIRDTVVGLQAAGAASTGFGKRSIASIALPESGRGAEVLAAETLASAAVAGDPFAVGAADSAVQRERPSDSKRRGPEDLGASMLRLGLECIRAAGAER